MREMQAPGRSGWGEAERTMHQKEEISTLVCRHRFMEIWGEREREKKRKEEEWPDRFPATPGGQAARPPAPSGAPLNPSLPLPLPSSAERHPQHRMQGLRCPDSPGAAAPAQWRRRPRCPHGGGAGCGGLEGAAGSRRTSRRPVGRRAAVPMGAWPCTRANGQVDGVIWGLLGRCRREPLGQVAGEGSHLLTWPHGELIPSRMPPAAWTTALNSSSS